jgi:hypothetical protein
VHWHALLIFVNEASHAWSQPAACCAFAQHAELAP